MAFGIYLFAIGFLTPAILIAVFYALILRKIFGHQHNFSSDVRSKDLLILKVINVNGASFLVLQLQLTARGMTFLDFSSTVTALRERQNGLVSN